MQLREPPLDGILELQGVGEWVFFVESLYRTMTKRY